MSYLLFICSLCTLLPATNRYVRYRNLYFLFLVFCFQRIYLINLFSPSIMQIPLTGLSVAPALVSCAVAAEQKRNSAVSNVGSIFSLFMSKCACRILFSFLMQADMRANSTAYATTSFSCCLSGILLRCQQLALCTRMYQQLCR